ncbi:Ketosteroid isomerase homolog [Blastococcus aurantiacus]|uniref:Ketosteroid isomerase homolog n=1 Tax=Blastococcus aurantiacus TaxID=1550231 RepID=A0A1G7I049_9ACTN|nr:nuclear transport factor 2 family protein [Blastococcus aurantiacus]SDF05953.1 Ketosteroid isomerase homolog [Blastococcus aurantiacus]
MTTETEASVRELIELHERWFAAAENKDVEASMEPISADIISYEHVSPLQFTALDDIRKECQRGFEQELDDFTWTVPDLRVIVREDLGVAWGLNRMASRRPDGTERVTWSRGTRIFRKVDGKWLMVHQHVSFPFEPETGAAALALAP